MKPLKTEYEEFKKYFEEARRWWAQKGDIALIDIIREITISREEIHQFFDGPSYNQICRECRGECCKRNVFIKKAFSVDELLYLAAIHYDPPEPDWEFLEKEVSPCLYLSESGCLLKENRPIICFGVVCSRIIRKLSEDDKELMGKRILNKLVNAREKFFREVTEIFLKDFQKASAV